MEINQKSDNELMVRYLISDIVRLKGLLDSSIDYEALTSELVAKTPKELIQIHTDISREVERYVGATEQPNEMIF